MKNENLGVILGFGVVLAERNGGSFRLIERLYEETCPMGDARDTAKKKKADEKKSSKPAPKAVAKPAEVKPAAKPAAKSGKK